MDFEKLLNRRGKKITGGGLLHDAQRFGEKLRSPATVKAMKALRDAFKGGASLNQIREQQRRELIERLHSPTTLKKIEIARDRLRNTLTKAKRLQGGKIRSKALDNEIQRIKFQNSLRLGGSPSTWTPKYLSKPRPINSELLGSILNRREKLRSDEGSAFVH